MMPGDLVVHQFPATGQTIRTIQRDGEPWFVARDVAEALDLRDHRTSVALLDDDERHSMPVTDSLGRLQDTLIINEAGLYSMVLRSRKPEAKAFKRWVTHEVLPAIRKTGGYAIPRQMTRRELAMMVIEEADRADRAEAKALELEPDAARARKTMDADGLSLVGTVAKRFGIRERALREFLYAEGLLIRDGIRRNEPMARFVQSGHFELKTRPIEIDPDGPPTMRSTTYVTPKGEALIWKRLHDAGMVRSPVMPARQLELIHA